MEKPQSLFIGACAGNIAAGLAFTCFAISKPPVLWYYPLERRWAFQVAPTGLAMDWFGRSLVALVAGAVVGAGAYALCRRLRGPGRRGLGLWMAWTATMTIFAASLYAYQLALRQPIPEPLPAWYLAK